MHTALVQRLLAIAPPGSWRAAPTRPPRPTATWPTSPVPRSNFVRHTRDCAKTRGAERSSGARLKPALGTGWARSQPAACDPGLMGLGKVTAVSRMLQTAPVGYTDQPDFVNAAALLQTELAPEELLRALLNRAPDGAGPFRCCHLQRTASDRFGPAAGRWRGAPNPGADAAPPRNARPPVCAGTAGRSPRTGCIRFQELRSARCWRGSPALTEEPGNLSGQTPWPLPP